MRYKLAKQQTAYYCFPACLQAVLREHGKEISQEEIARELNCTEEGASLKAVAEFLEKRKLKFEYHNYNETPFNEPDFLLQEAFEKGKHVLIAYPNSKGYHIFLVEHFSDPLVHTRDPKNAELYVVTLEQLMQKMHERKSGGFGLIGKLV